MQKTSAHRRFRPVAASIAAVSRGPALVDATGAIGSGPALAGRRMR